MQDSRTASVIGDEARLRRVAAWAEEMTGLADAAAKDLAARFDQLLELEPYLPEDDGADVVADVRQQLGLMNRPDVESLVERLPVFPASARQVLGLSGPLEIDIEELETVAKSDSVLAGATIAAANSCLWSGRSPISSLERAIVHLGTDTTRNVLMAVALRVMFGQGEGQELWRHSAATARAAERLARISGSISTGEAFLAGLVHDVGRLVFAGARGEAAARATRLTRGGCPRMAVERVVFGVDHASLGAEILDRWKFTEALQHGVRLHHWPERGDSGLAHLIYAAEFRVDEVESLPSVARLKSSCAALGVSLDAVTGFGFENAALYE